MSRTLDRIAQAIEFKYFPPEVTRGQIQKTKLVVPNAQFHLFALGKLRVLLDTVGFGVAQLLHCACCHFVRNAFQLSGKIVGGATLCEWHWTNGGNRDVDSWAWGFVNVFQQ